MIQQWGPYIKHLVMGAWTWRPWVLLVVTVSDGNTISVPACSRTLSVPACARTLTVPRGLS